ncbi:unnamed protein product [Cuscuta campestris]|uniref:CCHC-type domain-containing protein n=1 Tax=Cuscuta campestris TaxID=132261 RepID=A0A484KLQ7_9ASTE|nr:unnamed protein product [Cuscuta campestris]
MGSAPVTSFNGPTAATAATVTPLALNMASAIPVIPSLGPNTGVFTSAPVGHPTVMLPANSVKEPEKFTGVGFKIWQQRMLFWLTTLNLASDEGMGVSEAFQVAAIIHVLPPACDEFRSYLKLKRKEMTLEQLLVRLRICEEGLTREKKVAVAKANVVEHPPNKGSSKGPKPNKDKKKIGPKGGAAKTKFAGKFYNCGITGHRSSECRKKPQKKKQMKEEALCSELDAMDLCAVMTEVNLKMKKMKKLELVDATVGLSPPTFVERRRAMVGRRLLPSPVASIAAAKAAAHFLVWCDAPFLNCCDLSSIYSPRILPVGVLGRTWRRDVGALKKIVLRSTKRKKS